MRAKEGISLRNGINYAKYEICGMTLTKKLTEIRVLFSRQFHQSKSVFDDLASSRILNNSLTFKIILLYGSVRKKP